MAALRTLGIAAVVLPVGVLLPGHTDASLFDPPRAWEQPEVWMFAIHTLFRVCALAAGLLFALLGYLLFCKGVYEKAGDLTAAFGKDLRITLRAAAPGIFFALFGAAIAGYGLSRGVTFREGLLLNEPTAQIIEKVITGKPLEDGERRTLKAWLESTRQRARHSRESDFGWGPEPPTPFKGGERG